MSIEPSVEEQELLAETLRRERGLMSPRERTAELLVGAGFVLAVALLWWRAPPEHFDLAPAAVSVAVMALSTRVRFDTPLGFTVASQLAFVPLLFAVPAALVPFAVVLALTLGRLLDLRGGRVRLRRLWLGIGNAWFAIGPSAVFAIARTPAPRAGIALLVAALGAQFAVDIGVSTVRLAIDRHASFSAQLREAWVYAIDAALSTVGLLAALAIHSRSLATLALLPLLGLLAIFAHERHGRLEGLLELNAAYRGTALVLGDVVEADDGYTGEHSRSVVQLSLAVAERLGVRWERRRNLEFAALLHDVGKIAIPKEIINKPDKLDPREWTIIRTHTLEGQKMLDRVGGFMREVGLIVRSHHERWDGLGYPDGLAREQIPLEARIIACCDTWNAMRTDRPYRKALPRAAALAELRAIAGSQLDPRVVDVLVALVSSGEENGLIAEAAAPIASAIVPALGEDRADRRPLPVERATTLDDAVLDDVRAVDPVERLLEDSWKARKSRTTSRETLVEIIAGIAFLAVAIPLAASALRSGGMHVGVAVMLVALYAVVRMVKFPIGAGYAVPSYLVLVPMLLLLPPGIVPLLTALALVAGSGVRFFFGRGSTRELLSSVPDAWHALGPALVLQLAGHQTGLALAGVYCAALLAGFLTDLIVSVLREWAASTVPPPLQARVIAVVWLFDACIAPLGWLVAQGTRSHPAQLLWLLPVILLFAAIGRDRNARIVEAQRRLGLVAHERTRLQAAVHRLGDAFAAKLDLRDLSEVLLMGSVEALDADAGRLSVGPVANPPLLERVGDEELASVLEEAATAAQTECRPHQLHAETTWVLAVPLELGGDTGALSVARRSRAFRADEHVLMAGLVERAQRAASEIAAHQVLREQAQTDPLTRLGNRRKLSEDLAARLPDLRPDSALLLLLFDLDGFKSYNDTFGHVAGDALLARLGHKLAVAVSQRGGAYRLGGDEFCVLLPVRREGLQDAIAAAAGALEERGERFAITASCGSVLLPHEAANLDYALQLADKRLYARKRGRPSGAGAQAQDVLMHIIRAKQPALPDHANGVATLALAIGRRLGMKSDALDELGRAATLHDVGMVGLPDAILTKAGPLDPEEESFVRQHTLLGERILNAAPALRPVATVVRATHERWDGSGYPDGLRGEEIPLAARIITVCDAYQAMTGERAYRAARTPQEARRELVREAGRQFDPTIVAMFTRDLDRPTDGTGIDPDRPGAPSERRHDLAAAITAHVQELVESAAM